MKRIFWIVCMLPACALAQTIVDKSFPIQASQKLYLDFDYPEVIKVSTWDKQEVRVRATVSINRGENDNAFELLSENNAEGLTIRSLIRDKNDLPKRVLIKRGTEEFYFKTENYNDPEVQRFLEENGGEYRYMNTGVIMDIQVEVFIPKGQQTEVDAKYGIVEVIGCDAPLIITATYGGADISVPANGIAEIKAKTKYGEIYTNLAQKPAESNFPEDYNKWTAVTYNLGTGNRLQIESKYGKVYLRQAK